jgi:hypothetical protein
MSTIIVRKDRRTAVEVDLQAQEEGFLRIVAVRARNGPSPDCTHLIGEAFPDNGAVRRAVLSVLNGNGGDTLDRVRLSAKAYMAWQTTAVAASRSITDEQRKRLVVSAIPDERARAISRGRLLIWVDLLPDKRVELILEAGEWEWRPGQAEH